MEDIKKISEPRNILYGVFLIEAMWVIRRLIKREKKIDYNSV
ncbi:hypothetical protein J5U21_01771 [Saccharolobus shibatae]|uniref:Uncharacterized protein n=1 Tax=Saccharolobus shibatae TaxID=2286 RepID=A0A8F5BVD6_9CREN|nr:hypothetical protein J5U21_01771 [Saccharolobus shibatae]